MSKKKMWLHVLVLFACIMLFAGAGNDAGAKTTAPSVTAVPAPDISLIKDGANNNGSAHEIIPEAEVLRCKETKDGKLNYRLKIIRWYHHMSVNRSILYADITMPDTSDRFDIGKTVSVWQENKKNEDTISGNTITIKNVAAIKKPEYEIITSGNYRYRIISESSKTITIFKVSNCGSAVKIPKEIDGYKVVGLGWAGMESVPVFTDFSTDENNIIKKLEIPDSVTYVGEYSCIGLAALTELILPEKIDIGEGAFLGAKSLTELTLNECKSVADYAFRDSDINTLNVAGSLYIDEEEDPSFGRIKNLVLYPGKTTYDYKLTHIYAENLYMSETVKSVSLVGETADNVYICGKNTIVKQNTGCCTHKCKRIITFKGAKAVKFARKSKINYTTVTSPATLKVKVKKKPEGYVYKWKKAYTKRSVHTVNSKGKWKVKKSKRKASYDLYLYIAEKGEYELETTTDANRYVKDKKYKAKVIYSDKEI